MTDHSDLKQAGSIEPKETEGKQKKKKKAKKTFHPDFDKEKEKLKMFDPRGMQTLFRTLSRNHYNLLRMVDNKASIILPVNSIIISLLMGALYIAPDAVQETIRLSARILINCSLISMVFAVISMLPHRYIGRRFKDSSYTGSLYAANFSEQTLEEFQAEFARITATGHNVYEEMTKDLYFLGRVITGKQRMLWLSAVIFLVGLVATAVVSISNGLNQMM